MNTLMEKMMNKINNYLKLKVLFAPFIYATILD